MLSEFEKAKSNIPKLGTGKDVYLNDVKPDVYTPERAANQFLFENFTGNQWSASEKERPENPSQDNLWSTERQIHIYTLHCPEYFTWEYRPEQNNREQCPAAYSGIIRVSEKTTRQKWTMLFTAFIEQEGYPVSHLKDIKDETQLSQFAKDLKDFQNSSGLSLSSELEPFLESHGFKKYGFADIYAEDLERLFCTTIQEHANRTEIYIRKIYEESLEFLDYLTKMNIQIPAPLKAPIEFSLSHQLIIEMEQIHVGDTELHSPALLSSELEKILQLSKIHHLELDTTLLQDHLSEALTQYISSLSRQLLSFEQEDSSKIYEQSLELLKETTRLLEKAEEFGIVLDKTEVQNITYDILEKAVPRYLSLFKTALDNADHPESDLTDKQGRLYYRFFREYKFMREYLKLAKRLNFNVERYRNLLISFELGMSERSDMPR
jgi:hypothetical protein